MPRRPDLPCAICGELLWRGTGTLPEGQATCRPCRRAQQVQVLERLCVTCGGPKPSRLHVYCTDCKPHPLDEPGRTSAMGYGHHHQRLRQYIAPAVMQGGFVCTRYGHPQFPNCPGEILSHHEWELGHDDADKSKYTGPEHARCNERAGGLKRQGLLVADPVEAHAVVIAAQQKLAEAQALRATRAKRRRPVQTIIRLAPCQHCRVAFAMRSKTHKFCSAQCYDDSHRIAMRNKYRITVGIPIDAALYAR